VAVLVERIFYRPLIKRDDLSSALAVAFGAAFILRGIVIQIWGPAARVFPSVLPTWVWHLGGTTLIVTPLIALATATVVVVLFSTFVKRTHHGQAIAVIAQDRATAALMGIPTQRYIVALYALSGGIGMVGALLFASSYGVVSTDTGFSFTVKAWLAAIIGGLGRIEGAVLGGLLLGLFEAMTVGYVSATYSEAIVFVLLAGVLMIRPIGLLGRSDEART